MMKTIDKIKIEILALKKGYALRLYGSGKIGRTLTV